MNDIVQLWHAEHAKFTRLLNHLADRTARFADGENQHMSVMADILAYIHHYGERAHHAREDVGFARLARIDDSFRPVVVELREEHEAINNTGRALLEQFEGLANGSVILARDAVVKNAERYVVLQRTHLEREETEIIPSMAERLKDSDWQAVSAEIREKVDARLPPDQLSRFRTLSREIAEELALA